MKLKTKRLLIIPLSIEQLSLLCAGQDKLEADLGLTPSGKESDEHVKAEYEKRHSQCLEHPKDYLWHTSWQIILISENRSVGSAGFKGKVNERYEAEVGCFIDEEYQNRGYAAEALKKLCEWTFSQNAYYIEAQTGPENEPSKKVLEKCGFKQIAESENGLLYELEKPTTSYISLYMCLGLAVGLSIGMSLKSTALGMCIGIAIGAALGTSLDADDKKKRKRG